MATKMTPQALRTREDSVLDALENRQGDRTFRGRLYRDGVPSPEVYLLQPVRVLFVFREPNMPKQRPHDMREEVRDHFFRPITADGRREERSRRGWWNAKAGLFAHAVAAALDGEPWKSAFHRFCEFDWNHEVVNRFAYVQIKKVGGAGTANAAEIRQHAEKYRDLIAQQITLYQPNLVLGCGVGSDSPARLLCDLVLLGGRRPPAFE